MKNKLEQEIIRKRDKLNTPEERFNYVIEKAKEVFGKAFFLLKNAIIMTTNKINNKSYSLGYAAGLRTGKIKGRELSKTK